jgi:hypothetical protein
LAENTKGIIVWTVAIAAGLIGMYYDKQDSGEWDIATFFATGFVGMVVGWAIASIAQKAVESPQRPAEISSTGVREPQRAASEAQEVYRARREGAVRRSDDDIQTEMMASQLALMEQFGMDSMARGSVGNATQTVRSALDHGMSWEDALKFGRAVMLNTIKVERPGLLPPEGIESIGSTIQELEQRYGDDSVDIVIDEVQAWAEANE